VGFTFLRDSIGGTGGAEHTGQRWAGKGHNWPAWIWAYLFASGYVFAGNCAFHKMISYSRGCLGQAQQHLRCGLVFSLSVEHCYDSEGHSER
jgi:hypothetical protein